MKLIDIVERKLIPEPWEEGDNLPWHDEEMSFRILREHLNQSHDSASRRFQTIDKHVEWIHRCFLNRLPAAILDLGCGPGFYTSRLARLGHQCTGIDFSPASINFARRDAQLKKLDCEYIMGDLRAADFGENYDAAMLIFGEMNVFSKSDAAIILKKICHALKPGKQILLELHAYDTVREIGLQPPVWYAEEEGLFQNGPYLCLEENNWNAVNGTATLRFYVVDAKSADVKLYSQTYQAYTDEEYQSTLQDAGFTDVHFYPSLGGVIDDYRGKLISIVATKTP